MFLDHCAREWGNVRKTELEKTTAKEAEVAKAAAFLFGLEMLFHGEKKNNYDQYLKTTGKFESPASEPAWAEMDRREVTVGDMD